jgi:LPS-assembly protein
MNFSPKNPSVFFIVERPRISVPLGMPLGCITKTLRSLPLRELAPVFLGGLLALSPHTRAAENDPAPTEEELLAMPVSPPGAEDGEGGGTIPTIPDSLTINNDGAINFDQSAGTISFREVQITTDNGFQMFASEAFLDTKGKFVRLTGDVAIYQGTILHRGDEAIYYYEEGRLGASKLRTSLDPILLEAGRFRVEERNGKQVYIGENAGITTHDDQDPSYWIRAAKTTVIPGEQVIFKDMKLYAGDRAVFWLPYLSQSLNQELGYRFIPGAKSDWGPFLKSRYGIMLGGERDPVTGQNDSAWLLSQWHADILTRRGLGVGVDLIDTRLDDNPNLGWLKLYYLNDLDPTLSRNGQPRRDINEDRFRAQLRHRIELDWFKTGTTRFDADLTILSDYEFLEDFDPSVFRYEPNPENLFALTHQRDNSLFTLWTRVRPNDFYQSDTRLPEIAFDQIRSPIFGTPVFHEGQTLFGFYDEYLPSLMRNILKDEAAGLLPGDPRLQEIENRLADHGFTRFHTYQELSAPFHPTNWFAITPRIGLGYTNYSSVEGLGSSTDRTHLSASIDASIKFSRDYPNIVHPRWGIDGLRHIVQPYVTASWLATDELDSSFGRIDRLTASTRPRPLTVGRFNAIDDLEDWSIFRLGVRNRLLTRRDGETHEWLVLNTYVDVFLEDPEFDRDYSNLYNDLHWYPVPWIDLALETQFPIQNEEGKFTEVATSARYMPNRDLQLTLRQRFLDNHPILENSNRVEFQAYHRFNDNWGAGSTHRWEFEDSTLEYQQYSIHRNLNSWAISAGLFLRDNRHETESGFMIGFSLKDIPGFSVPLSFDSE